MAAKSSPVVRFPPFLEVVLGLVLPAGLLMALDVAWIRLGPSSGLKLVSMLVWVAAAVLTPIVFWRLWQRGLPGADGPRRWVAIAILTALSSLAWYYLAFTGLVNVHLAMGGSL